MVIRHSLVRTWATALSLVVFLVVALWGVGLSLKLAGNMGMPGCPFSADQTALCPLTLSQHISSWQSMFTATLQPEMLVAFWVVAVAFIIFSVGSLVFGSASPPADYLRGYLRTHPGLGREQYLIEALASGLIHPKLYR